ncbi:hypothetical protein BCR35DRAFT_293491 [Leucosporidium creatinivorum]|uniref:CNH domain-containing protein n=1 Tax=Leucosporidium creatinivorum TaxID=106004 RepID=A0A1Y2ER52_9BASI|nr:hypothetical protein BCR35DRAFT_293491 [Leucosporidium creatinivorum]
MSPRAASPASSGGRRTPTSPSLREVCALDLAEEIASPARKTADGIALLARLDKAVLLSEGILTFHSLSSLTPLSVHAFPALRGVRTFSLDQDELAGGGSPDAMHICAITKRTLHLLKVTNEGVTRLKDLPLPGGAFISVLRRGYVCIADVEMYSIIDLENAHALPLLPISQEPNNDARPLSTSSTASTPPPPAGVDPRQRPALACAAANEFLVASHTGSTTLGVFIAETGEPCRGTLEWASNLRSLVVDPLYSIALLHNNTIEIHSLHTQEIVQVVSLPTSSSPLALQPRSLFYSHSGIDLGSATGGNKVELVSVPLLPSSVPAWPTTPTRRHRSSMSSSSGMGQQDKGKGKGTAIKTLVIGKNSLYALTPLTLVVQADALMEKGRVEEALAMADQVEKAGSGGVAANPELAYVYLRAAYHQLSATLFQDAFNLFLRSQCDPRLVVRMFPDLREPLISDKDEVDVCQGVKAEVLEGKTVDDYIMANLTRNYSPHLKPDVETAPPTMELRAMLGTTARDCVSSYLTKWRRARKEGKAGLSGANDSRKVDMVVDTTLVRLLAEEGRSADLVVLLAEPNDCVFQQVEPALHKAGLYQVLTSLLLQKGEVVKTLEIWTKIVEGTYVDESFKNGLQQIFDLLWKTKDKAIVERFGLWLLQRDRALGLKLFSDPKQTLTFETRDLFSKIRAVDGDAADQYLEGAVLQERDTDSRLHADLVKRYIDRLAELLGDSTTKSHHRDQESDYATLLSTSPSPPPSFLSFLVSRYSSDSPNAQFDRVRLKAILFLGASSKYDVTAMKKELEEMEVKGLRGLTLERAIVYGKLNLDRQALSLLLHTLHDLTSAEAYSHQAGDPLLPTDVAAAAAVLALPSSSSSTKRKKGGSAKKEVELEERRKSLARLLVEMCLVGREGEEKVESEGARKEMARILETQAMHLDTLEVLPAIPSSWPLALLTPFLAGTLRRSLHSHQEASLLKALAVSQNFAVTERLGDLQIRMGGTLEEGDGSAPKMEPVIKLVEKKGREKGYSVGSDEAVELDLR